MVVLSLVALMLLVVAFWGVVLWGTPRDTDKRRLSAGPLGRLWRSYRSSLIQLAAWPVGWPHLVDLALGAAHTPTPSPGTVVWRHGKTTLTRLDGPPTDGEPVLVVHSLVTKPWILDLTPTRSLVRMLRDEGFDVFLLDWGDPDVADARRGLDDYAAVLRRAEMAVLERTSAKRLHQITYCMSSTLALHARTRGTAAHIASMVLIAPAVDFSVSGGFQRVMSHPLLPPSFLLDGRGGVPATVVREAFHGLRPQAIAAIRLRWARRADPEYREFYAGMARWAWTHRWLPGALFFDIVDLYRTNRLMEPGELDSIDVPMLVAIAERDHIVPSGSSHALTSIPSLDVRVVNVASGHVSMVVGTTARTTLWPEIVAFLRP